MPSRDQGGWMWAEALGALERAEQLHRQFFRPSQSTASWEPPVDVIETERQLWIIAALPGVTPEDLEIAIEGDTLRIAGQRRLPAVARGGAIHRLEVPYGRFERRIRLPAGRFKLARPELANGCLFLGLSKEP